MGEKMSIRLVVNFLWQFGEKCGTQGVQFIISIILARLLTPEDYGIIGLLTVFIAIATVFVEGGFGASLIQKKDSDEADFSSVFFFALSISGILYTILFFCSPFIAEFYNQPVLTNVLRIMSLSLFFGAINTVQKANISKKMEFKKFFFATLFSTIFSSIVGIAMAYKGFGVWALVWQHLSKQAFDTIILWFISGWKPKLLFSFRKIRGLISYGWKILASGLIDTIYNNIYSLIIGKYYSSADLGYYNKGKSFSYLVINNINSSINAVLFPAMSSFQKENEKVRALTRRAIKTSTFLIFPAMAGLAAVAPSFVEILLTEKWLPCVPFLRFCCFIYAFWPVHTANLQAIKALGRSDIFLKLEIIKKIVGVVILIITIPFGLIPMMIGSCISTVISSFINAFPNKKLLNYSYFEQIRDILPSFILSFAMCGIVWLIGNIRMNLILLMITQVFVGILFYIACAKIFKLETLEYSVNFFKKIFKR